jgi:hypothetical protein
VVLLQPNKARKNSPDERALSNTSHHTTHHKNPIKHSTASKIHAQAEDYIWTSKKEKVINFCEEWPPKHFWWL